MGMHHLVEVSRHGRRFLLATTVLCATLPVWALAQQASGEDGATALKPIKVERDSPRGPDDGIVAKRSRAGAKTDTPLIETPQAVSVVTSDQMEEQGANTVSQALRYTPGVLSEANGYDVRYDWLQLRGFNLYGTMWLDGLVLPGDPSNYATPSINPYALERVEVIKGPASVLYGRAIPGGLINQVSKRPQVEPHREVAIGASSFGGAQVSTDLTGPITEDGEWSYRFVGQARNMHTQIDRERDRQVMLAPSLTWAPSDATSLTLHGYYQHDRPVFSPRFYPAVGTLLPNANGQIPRSLYLGDPNANVFERDFYTAGYEFSHEFNDTWTVRQNLRYGHTNFLLDNIFLSGVGANGLNRFTRRFDESFDSFAVDNQLHGEFDTGALAHEALLGFDYSWSDADVTRYTGPAPSLNPYAPVYGVSIPEPTNQFINYGERYSQAGLYVQDQIKFGNGFIATLGGRYDWLNLDNHNRLTGLDTNLDIGHFSGRAGLSYVSDYGVAPYVSYSESFVPNSGVDASGNTFDPSVGRQWEVGVKYQPIGFDGLFTIAYFDIAKSNVLNYLSSGFAVATGEVASRGLELEGKFSLGSGWDFTGSYTYTNAEITEDAAIANIGNRPMLVPEHQASAWLNYTFKEGVLDGVSLGAGLRYVGETYGNNTNTIRVPGRTLVDLGASYRVNEHAKVSVNATNIFDKKYFTTCDSSYSCYEGDRRTVIGRLTVDF